MIPQKTFRFSGTGAKNIELGRPGASRAEIEAAALAIGAHEFISALPAGYDEPVGKRGGRLSAGQRQLISFTPAFLAAPALPLPHQPPPLPHIPTQPPTQPPA